MTTYIELSQSAQEQILKALKESNELALKGVQAWAEVAKPYTEQVPAAAAAGFPAPKELIANSFGFAQQVLDAQKAFATEVASTLTATTKSAAKA
jgi:hypothetical protein